MVFDILYPSGARISAVVSRTLFIILSDEVLHHPSVIQSAL